MPSLSSQFGGTREISSEQYQNTARNHENSRISKLKKLALSGAQLMALDLLTPDTHIAREGTKKIEIFFEKNRKMLKTRKLLICFRHEKRKLLHFLATKRDAHIRICLSLSVIECQ